jgi:hypothetical protein
MPNEKIVSVKKITLEDGKSVDLQLRSFKAAQFKALDDEGTFEAYVSVFGNVDSYNEVVDPGAFTDWLKNYFPRYPKGVWAHNWDEPISATIEAREDTHGLYIKGKLVLEVQRAREVWALMKAGVITDFSFGFFVQQDEVDPTTRVRHLKKIAIYEYSPVLVGANDQAMLLSVKSRKDGEAEPVAEAAPEATPAADPAPEAAPAADPAPAEEPATPAAAPAAAAGEAEPAKAFSTEALQVAIDAAKSLSTALEALKSAAEDAPPAGGAALQVEPRGRKRLNGDIKLIIRDARQADVAIGKLLRRAKTI